MSSFTSERELYAALSAPLSSINATVSQRLHALRPEAHVSHTELWGFDVDTYAAQGHCVRTPRADLPPVVHLIYDEKQTKLEEDVRHGWFDLVWQGHALEVVSLSWSNDNCPERHSWVIADTRAVAEAFIDAVCKACNEVNDQVLVFEDGYFRKSEELFQAIQRASFDDLVLGGTLKEDLRADVARFFGRKAFYEQHRIPWKRGLLLIGPPGNGKTQTLKALLREIGLPILYVKTFKDRNEDTKNIRNVFTRARRCSPCVIVVEDLDCAFDESTRSVFLNELDGFAANAGLLTIATTNHPHKLDRSILDRPSRFDRKFHFPLPAAAERKAYLAKWNTEADAALRLTEAGLDALVPKTDGFTFAYLKELVLSSALVWVDDAKPGAMDDIAARVCRTLKKEMESAHVVLGPTAGTSKPIGFSDWS